MEQIKEEQRDIDMNLFEKNFDYKAPDKMAQVLFDSRSKGDYYKEATCLEHFFFLGNKVKKVPEGVIKNKEKKTLRVVIKILDFYLNKLKQPRWGLKILTSDQMLSRLPIYLARLKAGNNSEKIKNEIRQLLYSLCR